MYISGPQLLTAKEKAIILSLVAILMARAGLVTLTLAK